MPRETNAAKRERAIEVCERLNRRYGPVECFLDHENPFRLLIAVLLSAQTTDAQVNKVTPRLFAQWPTPEAIALCDIFAGNGLFRTCDADLSVSCSRLLYSFFAVCGTDFSVLF